MGNTFGFNKNLNVFIETQKPYYNSGSSIQGTVFVQVKDNCTFNALYLRIQGTQQCQWFEGSSKNRRKYTGYEKFYVVQHLLHKFEGNLLQQGKYAYPFSLQLSDNIPGSFESSEHSAKIEYNLIAYFANYNTNQTVTYEKSIMVREPLRQDVSKYNGYVTTNPDATCGKIKLTVDYDRNVAYEGEDIQVTASIINEDGKNDLSRINAQLVQYTFVSSNGNASRTYRKVVSKQVKNDVVSKGSNRQLDFTFKIPTVKYQTAISTLVANYYRLQVCAEAGSGSENLSIYAPIFILKPTLEFKKQAGKQTNHSGEGYVQHKAVCIRSGEYFYKKNKNLDIVNFKNEDLVMQSVYGSQNAFR